MRTRFILAAVLFSAASAAWGATEYLRPTADANSTAVCAGTGTDTTAPSQAAVYTGKSGAGPVGASAMIGAAYLLSADHYSQAIFSSWQTTMHSYSTFILNVSISKFVINGAFASVWYSTNSGSTWTSLGTISSSQSTLTATITGTSPTTLQVGLCVQSTGLGSSATIRTYDIWTAGVYAAVGNSGDTFEDGLLAEPWKKRQYAMVRCWRAR